MSDDERTKDKAGKNKKGQIGGESTAAVRKVNSSSKGFDPRPLVRLYVLHRAYTSISSKLLSSKTSSILMPSKSTLKSRSSHGLCLPEGHR